MHGTSHRREHAEIIELIESIPPAMRRMGWTVSSLLMERWLRTPAWVLPEEWKKQATTPERMPSPGFMDQTTVHMSWAMSHERLRSAINKLRSKMVNERAKEELAGKVKNMKLPSETWAIFGSKTYSAFRLDQLNQCNALPFGSSLDPLDDMYGSLGMATLKVALIGEAYLKNDRRTAILHITHAGYYIRDTYDFNGFQFLGAWTKNGVIGSIPPPVALTSHGVISQLNRDPVNYYFNHSFAAYRRATGFGGDFIIYSDVLWEPANTTLELDLSKSKENAA